jgi:hypothetical protein
MLQSATYFMATYENQQFIDLSDEHSATHRSMNKDTRPATALAHERYQRQFHSRSTHSEEPRPANSYSLPTNNQPNNQFHSRSTHLEEPRPANSYSLPTKQPTKQPISLPEYTFGGNQTSKSLLTTNQTSQFLLTTNQHSIITYHEYSIKQPTSLRTLLCATHHADEQPDTY